MSSAMRGHALDMDEPADFGGTDKGPSPGELVLAALGGCQIITLGFYAQKLGVNLKTIETTVDGDLDLRGFMGLLSVRPGFQKIRVNTRINAEGNPQKIEKLARIAEERCPVLDTLRNGTAIETQIHT